MGEKNAFRRLGNLLQPIHDLALIGVRAEIRKREDLRSNGNFLSENQDVFRAFHQLAAQCGLGLVSCEQHDGIGPVQPIGKMVHDAAAGRHAACADDDGRAFEIVQTLGIIGSLRKFQRCE